MLNLTCVDINGYWIEDWKFLAKLKYLQGQQVIAKEKERKFSLFHCWKIYFEHQRT